MSMGNESSPRNVGMNALQALVEMYGKGGLEVTTSADAEEGNPPGRLLFRTVIQPNASIMTWVDPEHHDDQAWQRHHEKLQAHVQSIRQLRSQLNSIWVVFSIIYVVLIFAVPAPEDLLYAVTKLVVSVVGVYVLRVSLRYIARWYIRRQLRKYLPGW